MKHLLEQEIESIITKQQPILWIISFLPISAREMGWAPWAQAMPVGSQMVSISFCSFTCHCCNDTLVLFGLMFLQCLTAVCRLCSWLAQPTTFHGVTQKIILELKEFHLDSSGTGYQIYYYLHNCNNYRAWSSQRGKPARRKMDRC